MHQIPFEDRRRYFYDDDPYAEHPDVFDLYRFYNQCFFSNRLSASFLRWSAKMTLCAGTCSYQGMNSCTITLSEPLLKYRSNNELKETLLHEMIHAYWFMTDPESCKVNEGHGPKFLEMMHHINQVTRLNVTVYHTFHDEVDRCRQHIWKCDGPCQQKPPFFGIVKRSMNRPPQKADDWFQRHQRECGGTFQKIAGPEPKNKKSQKEPTHIKAKQKQTIPEQDKGKIIQQGQLNFVVHHSLSLTMRIECGTTHTLSLSTPIITTTQLNGILQKYAKIMEEINPKMRLEAGDIYPENEKLKAGEKKIQFNSTEVHLKVVEHLEKQEHVRLTKLVICTDQLLSEGVSVIDMFNKL